MGIDEILNIIGVIAFTISGALKAEKHNLDLLGIIALGVITPLGGEVIRGVLLDRIPNAILHDQAAIISIITAICVFLISRQMRKGKRRLVSYRMKLMNIVKICDAVGLAIFTVDGARIALQYNLSILSTALMATLTGVGGGATRDVLVREIPMVLKEEIYAVLCIAGGMLMWLVYHYLPQYNNHVAMFVIVSIIIGRLLAIKYQVKLPSA